MTKLHSQKTFTQIQGIRRELKTSALKMSLLLEENATLRKAISFYACGNEKKGSSSLREAQELRELRAMRFEGPSQS